MENKKEILRGVTNPEFGSVKDREKPWTGTRRRRRYGLKKQLGRTRKKQIKHKAV
jgi:hypothetical protein